MARMKKDRVIQAPSPDAAAGQDDLEVLHPNRSATIAGRSVTVREYGFIEGMRLRPLLQPFLDDLHTMMLGDALPGLDQITMTLGAHIDAVSEAVAIAADVELEWLAGLSQDDGMHLLMLWWGANGPFYVRSVRNRIATDRAVEKLRAGQMSTPSSSPPATETPNASAS
ncbi:DUF6631 family protein [Stutzerimonas nitrititolerans]|uniref:DUF6631 family protein n=1 Tax=Stutzerimonas nitrititolerans TaxID=2482751 RepID=UPI002896452B|nr:DUF6631 family protein [Stutzerimonas nitrititolerans]